MDVAELDVADLQMLAERDDAGAQTGIGVQFEAGRGVERDYAEAVTRYRRAAEQGSPSRRAVLTLGWHAHHVQIPSEGGSSGARSPVGSGFRSAL